MHQDIFGYAKFSSVTTMLVELGLPSFNAVLHNSAASFSSINSVVKYGSVCNCGSLLPS